MDARVLDRPEPDGVPPERRRFTLNDVFAMQEAGVLRPDEKYELIDGDLIRMSPQGVPHFVAKNRLARHFNATVGPSCEVYVEPTLDFGAGMNPEPEIVIVPSGVRWSDLRPTDLKVVLEVSVTSLQYDLGRKAELYAQFGVLEYWAFDARTRRMHIHLDAVDGAYRSRRTALPEETIAPRALPRCALHMATWPPFE